MPRNENDPITIIQNARAHLNQVQATRQQTLGRIQTLMEQLQQEFGLSSMENATSRMVVIDRQIQRLRNEFQHKYDQLIQEHPWVIDENV